MNYKEAEILLDEFIKEYFNNKYTDEEFKKAFDKVIYKINKEFKK